MTLCTETNFYIGAPLGKALESTSRNVGVTESVPGSGLAPETAVRALADMSPEPRSLAGQGAVGTGRDSADDSEDPADAEPS